jgi:hypothetical protein
MADIDLDFQSDFVCQDIFPEAIQASMVNKKNELIKHPCGQYFQDIAIDSVTQLAAIPFEEAEILGYFKIDFLHFSPLNIIQSKQEIRELSNKEPDWNLLQDEENVKKLSHIGKHYELIEKVNPHSVNDLSAILALIRPSKRYLIPQYINTKSEKRYLLEKELYAKPKDGKMWFKKGHAISYALTIVIQLHLLEQKRL